MTNLADITAALIAALHLATVPYDFSGTDAVQVGLLELELPTVPCAAIEQPQIRTRPFDKRQRLWWHDATFIIRCWVPFSRDLLGTRLAASNAAVSELANALHLARVQSPTLRLAGSFVIGTTALDSTLVSTAAPDLVHAAVAVTISYITAGGV